MRTRKMTADLDIRPYIEGGMDFENAEEEQVAAFADHPVNAEEHS